ncbi:hypothetical protein HELRODRAFT_109215 [Helobdella robusta]|uniref:4'-phosphopantetheine phosphatase n=1 Tax=Helobdella robusta TaxID=6412 RepID=T1EER4_HELRO|nr:hypothetical protein HELRODRAFT_109215 [Helobdella robusta]ESO10934.1 hypothetical protein HELRODRAFT_109215 [Helobdella robusta]
MANKTKKNHLKNNLDLATCEVFKHLRNAKRFAIDIGGSLAKLAYYSTVSKKKPLALESTESSNGGVYKVVETDEMRDELRFVKFESRYMETCIDFIRKHLVGTQEHMKGKVIKVTGGGAYKFKDLLCNKLGVQVDKEDEMECLIKGCNFLLKNIPDEAFVFNKPGNPDYRFLKIDGDSIFPYLLVNIGSGVSLIKAKTEFERIGGSSLGGGTFWGLGSLLTNAKGFDELLQLAEQGEHKNVDMLVGDIYGGAYQTLHLPSDLIASSFGKAARSARDRQHADMAKSLLISISNDIGQIACLNARLHNLERIFFGGYFIRGHPITMYTMTYAINFWSKGSIQAMFLRHEGYLGAIGAFLKGCEEEDTSKYCWTRTTTSSWAENYAGSSGLKHQQHCNIQHLSHCSHNNPTDHQQQQQQQRAHLDNDDVNDEEDADDEDSDDDFALDNHILYNTTFDVLELDRFSKPLVCCPLLNDPNKYVPDTVDLTRDQHAREYWLQCFHDATEQFAERAVQSQPSKSDAEQRALKFKEKYISRLKHLRVNPCSYGSLTVRSLLDTREHCLEEFHFVDPYSLQKQQENEQALSQFKERINELDLLNFDSQWFELVRGVLAGNVFDWGAKAVTAVIEYQQFGFHEALNKIPERPWLIDNFDSWMLRVEKGVPYKCVVIFVDNSGLDIILGIFPFSRALLKMGSKVILCANSRPVLNDVTYHELIILTKRLAKQCDVINLALNDGRLLVMESGQGSPCLDLRYIDYDLGQKMMELNTDLIILEGMGRSIHTNLFAKFSCDVLKVTILKNKWLAESIGGKMFDVVFKYESSSSAAVAADDRSTTTMES